MDEYQAVKILLVEDSDADAEMTLRALRKGNVANHVVRVHDGIEALDFMFYEGAYKDRSSNQPNLILLDVKMPRCDGIEVARRLKANDRTKIIPIVMLTSSAEDKDVIESYGVGVNSYLVKPVDIKAFTDLIIHAGMYWSVMNKLPPFRS